MDRLPFDALRHIFRYLNIKQLETMCTLGAPFVEAAQSVARCRHSTHTLTLADTTYVTTFDAHCQFLAGFVRSLTVVYFPNINVTPAKCLSVIRMIGSAERLSDLTLNYPAKSFDFAPDWLARVQRLTLNNICDCDHWVAAVLSTCSPDRLTALHIDRMCLSGRCLMALSGPQRSLYVCDMVRADSSDGRRSFQPQSTMDIEPVVPGPPHLINQHRMHNLDVCTTNGKKTDGLRMLVDKMDRVNRLLAGGDRRLLDRLAEMQRLSVRVDECEAAFMRFVRTVGRQHPLHDLTRCSHQLYTEQMGIDFQRFVRLERLHLDMYTTMSGLDTLLHALRGHPALRNVTLVGCELQTVSPLVVWKCVPEVRSLHVRADLTEGVSMLARLAGLRELKLRLIVPLAMEREQQMATTNRFLRALAAENRLEALHLQVGSETTVNASVQLKSRSLELEPLTVEALRRFSSLRELRLVMRCERETMKTVLRAMGGLRVFECTGDARMVGAELVLQRLRPDMERVRVDVRADQI